MCGLAVKSFGSGLMLSAFLLVFLTSVCSEEPVVRFFSGTPFVFPNAAYWVGIIMVVIGWIASPPFGLLRDHAKSPLVRYLSAGMKGAREAQDREIARMREEKGKRTDGIIPHNPPAYPPPRSR